MSYRSADGYLNAARQLAEGLVKNLAPERRDGSVGHYALLLSDLELIRKWVEAGRTAAEYEWTQTVQKTWQEGD